MSDIAEDTIYCISVLQSLRCGIFYCIRDLQWSSQRNETEHQSSSQISSSKFVFLNDFPSPLKFWFFSPNTQSKSPTLSVAYRIKTFESSNNLESGVNESTVLTRLISPVLPALSLPAKSTKLIFAFTVSSLVNPSPITNHNSPKTAECLLYQNIWWSSSVVYEQLCMLRIRRWRVSRITEKTHYLNLFEIVAGEQFSVKIGWMDRWCTFRHLYWFDSRVQTGMVYINSKKQK